MIALSSRQTRRFTTGMMLVYDRHWSKHRRVGDFDQVPLRSKQQGLHARQPRRRWPRLPPLALELLANGVRAVEHKDESTNTNLASYLAHLEKSTNTDSDVNLPRGAPNHGGAEFCGAPRRLSR